MRAGLRYGVRGEFVSGEPNNVLVKRPVACQTAPATTATSCNQLVSVPHLTDNLESRFNAAVHGGQKPQKTRKSSALRRYIGYVSSRWHTRQPQPPQQLPAISWCRSPAYRTTERAVSMPRSTEGKNPQNAEIECSAAVNALWEWVGAYQTAPGS